MSSGLRFSGAREPEHLWGRGVADHQLVYARGDRQLRLLAGPASQRPPETVGRYRDCDIAALGAIAARSEQAAGRDPLTLVERLLFQPLGIRRMTLSADACTATSSIPA